MFKNVDVVYTGVNHNDGEVVVLLESSGVELTVCYEYTVEDDLLHMPYVNLFQPTISANRGTEILDTESASMVFKMLDDDAYDAAERAVEQVIYNVDTDEEVQQKKLNNTGDDNMKVQMTLDVGGREVVKPKRTRKNTNKNLRNVATDKMVLAALRAVPRGEAVSAQRLAQRMAWSGEHYVIHDSLKRLATETKHVEMFHKDTGEDGAHRKVLFQANGRYTVK